MIDLSRVRVSGPLSGFAPGFTEQLIERGYKPQSARRQIYLVNHLSKWLVSEGLDVAKLHANEVERFQRDRYAAGYRSLPSIRAMQPILGYLRDIGIAPAVLPLIATGALEAFIKEFHTYLTVERGVQDETASRYIQLIHPYLQTRMLPDCLALDFRNLTASHVISFVVKTCPPLNPGMAGLTVTALRSMLRYLHVDGKMDRSLLSAVPTVSGRRLTGLPKALNPDQVKCLLASCDTTARSGFRDLAVLTMLVRLGLRAGEVAKLEFDHIDWRAGEIVIANSKGNRTERIPLPADVGKTVTAYLQYGRPVNAHCRTIFAGASAPHHALTNSAVSVIVARAAQRCGLGRVHAHRLRHTAATLMLRSGASLQEIGQLLRHRNAITTAIYAKVDRDALRSIARPWPGEAV